MELDPANAEVAAVNAEPFPLVEVVCGDAALTDVYLGAVPAELVLVCGVFGNIVDSEIERLTRRFPEFCTRTPWDLDAHRRSPDLTPTIREWFADSGFAELTFVAPDDAFFSVGADRLVTEPRPLVRRALGCSRSSLTPTASPRLIRRVESDRQRIECDRRVRRLQRDAPIRHSHRRLGTARGHVANRSTSSSAGRSRVGVVLLE